MISIENLLNQITLSLDLDSIDFSSETSEQIQKLASHVKKNPNLSFIHYCQKKLSSFNFIKAVPIFQAMKENNNIQHITFDNCSLEELDQNQSNHLLQCLKISGIKSLNISRNSITKECPAINFILKIPETQVETLQWTSDNLWLQDNAFFCSAINVLSSGNLSSLSLSAHSIGGMPEGTSCSKALLILFNSNLKEVALDFNPLGCGTNCEDWVNIFRTINQRGILKSLRLWNCCLEVLEDPENQDFIELLASFLKETKVEIINLGRNKFSKEAAAKILKAALQNKGLTLEFKDSGLTDKEIEELRKSNQDEEKTKMDKPVVLSVTSSAVPVPVLTAFSSSIAPLKSNAVMAIATNYDTVGNKPIHC